MASEPDLESLSFLSSVPTTPQDEMPSSPLSSISRTPSPPPSFSRLITPPLSQDAGEEMPRPRKRRKTEAKVRTTQYLDLTSDTAQSEYDHREAMKALLKALRHRRKIVVIAGAGISVSAGIPDFRSSNGLFHSLKGEHKLKGSGKSLFDAAVYKDATSTSQFHDMVRKLSQMSQDAEPTAFHRLLARLSTEGRLLRLYTQNVDGLETQMPPLETKVPLPHKGPWPQTVQLHGGLEKMTCQKCREIMDFDPSLFEGSDTPQCPNCRGIDNMRTNELGKRSHGVGRLRPRIVLYNEQNPDDEAIGAVSAADMRTRPDAVVVVGTSMKIPGVRRIVSEMCKIVRDRREGTTIWINPDPEPSGPLFENCWDLIVKGGSDEVARLANLKAWDDPEQHSPDSLELIDSDVERAMTSRWETQSSTLEAVKQSGLVSSFMTPPRSQDGESNQKRNRPQPPKPSPIRIKLLVKEQSHALEQQRGLAPVSVNIQNPASQGKKLSDVLGREKRPKRGRPRTSQIKKVDKHQKADGKTQTRINGRITKSAKLTDLSAPKRGPPSPGSDSATNAQALEVCIPAYSPSARREQTRCTSPPETISPVGKIPRDMVRLLN